MCGAADSEARSRVVRSFRCWEGISGKSGRTTLCDSLNSSSSILLSVEAVFFPFVHDLRGLSRSNWKACLVVARLIATSMLNGVQFLRDHPGMHGLRIRRQ